MMQSKRVLYTQFVARWFAFAGKMDYYEFVPLSFIFLSFAFDTVSPAMIAVFEFVAREEAEPIPATL